jgi:hypothetical protein
MGWTGLGLVWFAAAAGALGLFLSKPERKGRAWTAAICILLAAVVQTRDWYSGHRDERAMRRVAVDMLRRAVNSELELLSEIIIRGSDGWLPHSDDEFFSPRSATIICRQFDASREYSQRGPTSWRAHAADVNARFRHDVEDVLAHYGRWLDADTVTAAADATHAPLVGLLENALALERTTREFGRDYPPVFAVGAEDAAAGDLQVLRRLNECIVSQCRDVDLDPNQEYLRLPEAYVARRLGSHHISNAALEEWMASHDYPGPLRIGSGDPNKQ